MEGLFGEAFLRHRSDPEKTADLGVVIGRVTQGGVVVVASVPHHGQHQNLPEVHALAAPTRIGVAQDVGGDPLQQALPHLGPAVQILQGGQDGGQLEAGMGVQNDLADRRQAEGKLRVDGGSHPCALPKICGRLGSIRHPRPEFARKRGPRTLRTEVLYQV